MFKFFLAILFLWLLLRIGTYFYRVRGIQRRNDSSRSTNGVDRSKIEDAEFSDVEEEKDMFRGK
jgi:hypothetical protein